MNRKISQVGIKLIQEFEGCSLKAYKAVPTEKWYTIGWGFYDESIKKDTIWTQQQADERFLADIPNYERYVNNPAYVLVTAQLNQNQFDALVSFCYNCGPGNLQSLCKGRTIAQIADNITKYDKAGGKVLNGLVRRRKAEQELFNKEEVKPVADDKKVPAFKESGREWLIKKSGIEESWKATDTVDIGTLGTILSRLIK